MRSTNYQRLQRRMRRRFLRRLKAPASMLRLVVEDGAVSERTAWKLYSDAFWDGVYDEMNVGKRHA